MFQPLNAKVEAPNYNFSLEALDIFYPGKKIAEIEEKYGKGEIINNASGIITYKFYVAHIRYKFPVIVQAREGIVLDFFARLPSYFLHDVYFQSIINRLGKQTLYKKVHEEAYYVWDKAPLKHIYSAACTITCFPIFYTVHPLEINFQPLIKKMKNAYK
ncbi:MAG: hypothetical protein AB7I27_15020 [Bacteriovoracaceae bacterium]